MWNNKSINQTRKASSRENCAECVQIEHEQCLDQNLDFKQEKEFSKDKVYIAWYM